MDELTDEILSGYIDGVLTDQERAAVERALDTDGELRAKLEALRSADALARAAFRDVLDDPIPDRLRALIDNADLTRGEVVAFTPRPRAAHRPVPAWFDGRIAAAAALALAAGVGGGMLVGAPGQPAQVQVAAVGLIPQGDPLARILDRAQSSAAETLPNGETVTPVLSFAAADGRYCREFELAQERAASIGVACRGEQGWRIEVLLASGGAAGADGGYAPASGPAAALDSALAGLGAGAPLDAAQEQALIANGWTAR